MSDQKEINIAELESLSLDELRKRAEAELRGEQEQSKEQPRDEQGRFTKADEADENQSADADPQAEDNADDEVIDVTPKAKKYRRVVEIGEGVDPEVFEANSLEELLDKIADAKAHATRKIRQQESELRKQREPEVRKFSDDEEYVYSQELMTKPTKAFADMFKQMVGMDITQFKTEAERITAFNAGVEKDKAISSFIATHPDYEDSQRNTDLMVLAMQGKQVTVANLEKAYSDLKGRGLLLPKSEKQNSVQDEEKQSQAGITNETAAKTSTQGTKKTSSLTTKNRTVPVKNEPSEDDLYNMPKDKLRELANKQMSTR